MKKFTLRGVLDGFRSTVGSSSSSGSTSKADASGIEETIWSEHFQVAKVGVADYISGSRGTAVDDRANDRKQTAFARD